MYYVLYYNICIQCLAVTNFFSDYMFHVEVGLHVLFLSTLFIILKLIFLCIIIQLLLK